MSNLRQTTVVGRVGADAEYNDTGSKPRANFSVAVNQWNPDTKTEETVWVRCTAWERDAVAARDNVKKGMRVWVAGRHSIYNGTNGDVEQISVNGFGPAAIFFSAGDSTEEEW